MTGQTVVIDGRDHLVGRLASVVAKKLLQGVKIVVVRCELLAKSGHVFRSQRKALQFRVKRTATNPKWGPFHHRAPSRVFHRVVRGMLPHKTSRGAAALNNLKVFDGCPAPYDTQKKVVVPQALRALRLRPGVAHCSLGEVQKRVGWQYSEVVARLEDARKAKAFKWHLERKAKAVTRAKHVKSAANDAKVKPYSALLSQYGF